MSALESWLGLLYVSRLYCKTKCSKYNKLFSHIGADDLID